MSKELGPSDSPFQARASFSSMKRKDGRIQIDVRLENETVWMTQQPMADLFQTTKQNIGQHLKRIFLEGALLEDPVVKKLFTTAADENVPGGTFQPGRHHVTECLGQKIHKRLVGVRGKGE